MQFDRYTALNGRFAAAYCYGIPLDCNEGTIYLLRDANSFGDAVLKEWFPRVKPSKGEPHA